MLTIHMMWFDGGCHEDFTISKQSSKVFKFSSIDVSVN